MRLDPDVALARLAAHDHGVLATTHATRGVDLVPCVFAVADGRVAIPVDRVKPKASSRLQRERNLETDPRAALLVDVWDAADWSRLWWVRAELRWEPDPSPEPVSALSASLARRYPQYEGEPFERVLVLAVVGVTGWAASGGGHGDTDAEA